MPTPDERWHRSHNDGSSTATSGSERRVTGESRYASRVETEATPRGAASGERITTGGRRWSITSGTPRAAITRCRGVGTAAATSPLSSHASSATTGTSSRVVPTARPALNSTSGHGGERFVGDRRSRSPPAPYLATSAWFRSGIPERLYVRSLSAMICSPGGWYIDFQRSFAESAPSSSRPPATAATSRDP